MLRGAQESAEELEASDRNTAEYRGGAEPRRTAADLPMMEMWCGGKDAGWIGVVVGRWVVGDRCTHLDSSQFCLLV